MTLPLRLLRGGVLGLVVVALSLGAHTQAGGPAAPAVVAGVVAAAVLGCCALAGRELSLGRLLAVLLLGQLAVHLVLEFACSPGAAPATSDEMPAMAGMADPPGAVQTTADAIGLSTPMVVGHVAAAILAALVLRYGETLLLRLMSLLSSSPARLASLVPLAVPGLTPRRPVSWEPPGGRTTLLTHSMRRRGPPVAAAG